MKTMRKSHSNGFLIYILFFLSCLWLNALPAQSASSEHIGFWLVDVANGTRQPLLSGAVFEIADFPTSYSLSYEPEMRTADVVWLELRGPVSIRKKERREPYALFGDKKGRYHANPIDKTLLPGDYILAANDFMIEFSIVDSEQQEQEEASGVFKLIDAETDVELMDLTDGLEIDSQLLPESYSIVYVVTSSQQPSEVNMRLSGAVSVTKKERSIPYALFGDAKKTDVQLGENNRESIDYHGNPDDKQLLPGEYLLSANADQVAFVITFDQAEQFDQLDQNEMINAPSAVTLLAPVQHTDTYMKYPNFFWQASADSEQVVRYEIEIAMDDTFAILADSDAIEVARYVPVDGLAPGYYFWRVRAVNEAGVLSEWSDTLSFHIHDRSALPVYNISQNMNLNEAQSQFQKAINHTPAIVAFEEGGEFRYDASQLGWEMNHDAFSVISYWSKDGGSALDVNLDAETQFIATQLIEDVRPDLNYTLSASIRFGAIQGSGQGARIIIKELDRQNNIVGLHASQFYKRSWGDWIDLVEQFRSSSQVDKIELTLLVDNIIGNVVFDAISLNCDDVSTSHLMCSQRNIVRNGGFEQREDRLFSIRNADNLIIEGNGATIVSESKSRIFDIENSANMIVENLNLDYDPLPYSILDVVAVNPSARTMDVQLKPGYLSPLDPLIADAPESPVWAFDENHVGRGKYGTYVGIYNIEVAPLAAGLYRFSNIPIGEVRKYAVNDTVIKQGRYNGTSVIRGSGNENLTFYNVMSYASYAGSFVLSNSSKINFLRSGNDIKPGRYTSANADTLHFYHHRVGPWVEGSVFNAQGDDAVNFKSHGQTIIEKLDATTLRFNKSSVMETYQEGDRVYIIERKNEIKNLVETHILRLTHYSSYTDIIFDVPVGEIYPGRGEDRSALFNSDLSTGNFVIRDNIFKNNRARGISIQSKGLIADNEFEGIAMSAVYLKNHMTWNEGFLASGSKVLNNRIFESGHNPSSGFRGAIHVEMVDATGDMADFKGQKDIAIEGNLIRDWNNTGILISNGDSIRVKDNRIDNEKYEAFLRSENQGIRVVNSEEVELLNNHVNDSRDLTQDIFQ